MNIPDWEITLVSEDQSFLGSATLVWECKNTKEGFKETVKTELDSEKVYPEENFEYEGEINGKEVEGSFITGHGPVMSVWAIDSNQKLSPAESVAGKAHIDWIH